MPGKYRASFLLLVAFGLIIRFGFVLRPDPHQLTYLSGGSDAPVYALLAGNLLSGKGFTYHGQPSAFRPPGYPLLLAGFRQAFGDPNYITAVRVFQFLLGLATVWICARIALRLFGADAQRASLVFGLFLPTLIFSTAQLLTECVSAFLTALFLWLLIDQQEKADVASACGLGVLAGLQSLLRFNAAALPLFALWPVLRNERRGSLGLRLPALLLLPLLVLAPWFIRNQRAFHGHTVYSTHMGANAVQGVVTSQGRTQPGDTEKLKAAMGWSLQDLETNRPSRDPLGSELELNRRALAVVPRLWKQKGWSAIALLLRKLADFWLSTDQLLDVSSLYGWERLLRITGALFYLIVLGFAVAGWLVLRRSRPALATLFLVYMAGFTLLHLPLVMNTRLRIPLMDPLLVTLAGGGCAVLARRWISRDSPAQDLAVSRDF